jgi:hypothetical protein
MAEISSKLGKNLKRNPTKDEWMDALKEKI